MNRSLLTTIATCVIAVPVYCQTPASPSLTETFDWIANTLKSSEGNNSFTHFPTPRSYVKQWVDEEINPFHRETIENFSQDGCRVTFEVEMVDNDMGFLLGKVFYFRAVDTFDLKDIDSQSIRIQDSCKAVDTPSGPVESRNCEDEQGKIVVFQTIDAKPKIHEESHGSSSKSRHGYWRVRHHEKLNLNYIV